MTYCQKKKFSAELCSGKSTFIQQIIKKCHFSLTQRAPRGTEWIGPYISLHIQFDKLYV